MLRRDPWIAILGTSATILVVALAWAATTDRLPVWPAFVATLGTVAWTAFGFRVRLAFVRADEERERAVSRAESVRLQVMEQRQSVDALSDGLDIALFICDASGNVQYANPTALAMFAVSEAAGRNLLAVTLSYDLDQLVKTAARSDEPQVRQLTLSQPSQRIVVIKSWKLGDEQGRVFLTVDDVTDLRRLERVRQDFVANVSHELRTPMTLIRAMAETLYDDAGPDDELPHKYLPQIMSEVDRLSSITQDLLVLSAAESNTAEKQLSDLADVLEQVISPMVLRAEEKGLELRYFGPDSLIADVNPSQMKQVVINLVENALRYTQVGFVEVRLRGQDSMVILEVEDTGMGIASEHQGRVFERFYRVDKARSRASGGTGLGLSIVKHIVEAHGGSVTLDSSLNQGSTFTVRIPIGSPVRPPEA